MLPLLMFGIFLCGQALASPDENADLDAPDLFQGDMILLPEERMAVVLGMDVSKGLTRGSTTRRLWPNGIVYYELNATLASNAKAKRGILTGMRLWSSQTCIKFRPRTTQTAYVHIFQGKGCFSNVGRTGRRQRISLGRGCWGAGTVSHELAHTLGFHHEQSRPDRDDYVTINFQNIKPGKAGNFKKYSVSLINSLGTPYDYASVMHYGARAFSINKQPTIVPKQPGVTIGKRKGPSPIDIKQMNLLYKCS